MEVIKEGAKKIPQFVKAGAETVKAKANEYLVQEKVKTISQKAAAQAGRGMKTVVHRGSEAAAKGGRATLGKIRERLQKYRFSRGSNDGSKPSFIHKVVRSSTEITQKAIVNSTPHLKTIWDCAKTELRPPSKTEILDAIELAKEAHLKITTRQYLCNTLGQALQTTLVVIEVTMWFFVGEILGRKSLIGYKV